MNIPKQDYSPAPVIPGVEIIDLKVHKDDGGSFRELIKACPDELYGMSINVGGRHLGYWSQLQVNASELEPGVIKAYHYHPDQWDLWYVQDKMLVSLIDCREMEAYCDAKYDPDKPYWPIEFCQQKHRTKMRFVLEDQLLLIPPRVAHGICNPYNNTRRMTYFVSEFFGTGEQEGRIPWNVLGDEVWALSKG